MGLLLISIFERRDGRPLFQDVADFIETFEDAGLRERIDWKCHSRAAVNGKSLGGEIDGHGGAGLQQRMGFGIHDNWEKAVFQTVLAKDIGEAGGDHGPEAEIHESPWGVLARTATAEIVSGNKNLRTASNERAKLRTVSEEMLSQAGFIGDFQETRRNNLIGIDVFLRYHNHARRDLHKPAPNRRGSATRPSIALAAAVSGDASRVRAPFP